MANLYVTQFTKLFKDANGNVIQAGFDNGATISEVVPFTGTSAQSAAFADDTTFIMVSTDATGFVEFGANPTAVATTSARLIADTPIFYGVEAGQKIAAIV